MEVISSLSRLQVFSMVTEEFRPSAVVYYHEGFLLEELGRLEELEDIRITIHSAIGAEAILKSPALQQSIKKIVTQPLL